ncbi:hypothetical protein ABT269_39775 [Streptomyces viridosporus]|uniref:hypothetical protein n=1 Tax=Streptomyces viridosporus TaxID=67581 RepID=UPI00331C1D8D
MASLPLTTVRDLDNQPVETVHAEFDASLHRPHTWMVIATARGDDPVLYPYGPFADPDGARDWAETRLAAYGTRYTVTALAAPYTRAAIEEERGRPLRVSARARPASDRVVARQLETHGFTRLPTGTDPDSAPLRAFTARDTDHPGLGPVVEITALGPLPAHHRRAMTSTLPVHYPRYEAVEDGRVLLVRYRSAAELHARADRAAARVAPHIAALTAAPGDRT